MFGIEIRIAWHGGYKVFSTRGDCPCLKEKYGISRGFRP